MGSFDPLIIPVGGLKRGVQIEAAPSGNNMILNLIFQLAGKILAQTVQPENTVFLRIADHPLMQPGPQRRDNLAMLLALATCQNIIGLDSTRDAYSSAFWTAHHPGRQIFEKYLLNRWILTPDKTLADWITEEPDNSRLVAMTRPPQITRHNSGNTENMSFESLPLKGQLGFTVTIDESNYLVVDTIDTYRLAYACGLRIGDRIRSVDGHRVRNHRQLVVRILETLEKGGAMVQIIREDEYESVLIQPMFLPAAYDSLYLEDEHRFYQDSITVPDSLDYH